MRFTLIDRICELEPGKRATAIKNLTMAEEYLADHFPLFPVMPGVLMLEAMTQTAAWLIRYSEDFAHSVVTMKEVRNVKYADFVQPGQVLSVEVEQLKDDGRETTFKARGLVEGKTCVSARLIVERYNLAERNPADAALDAYCRGQMKALFERVYVPSPDEEKSGRRTGVVTSESTGENRWQRAGDSPGPVGA